MDSALSLIDRINAGLLRRLRGGGIDVAVDPPGIIRAGSRRLPVSDIAEAGVVWQDVFRARVMTLSLVFSDGSTLAISEEDAAWRDVLDELDRDGRFPKSRDWLTEMIGHGPKHHRILLAAEG